ncbi:caax amino terminal protease family protein [Cyclospora cayetanensis]|uniref:Caax amino terminal protease family protein n=1 Tax=Cyclospora cayetanensis TaxID=88456 RepID=A0A1D3D489_9EIME|nr:caax amino terminal protease family protein [Cyclospora cayetanensis]
MSASEGRLPHCVLQTSQVAAGSFKPQPSPTAQAPANWDLATAAHVGGFGKREERTLQKALGDGSAREPKESIARCLGVAAALLLFFSVSGHVAAAVELVLAIAAAAGVCTPQADIHRALQAHLLRKLAAVCSALKRRFSLVGERLSFLRQQGEQQPERLPPYWYSCPVRGRRRGGLWVWWALLGYCASCLCFNIAECINTAVLAAVAAPRKPVEESLVHALTDPSNNSAAALLLAAAAPCVSAPPWEELVYRGFCLPLLGRYISLPGAIAASSFLFSLHHMSLETLLPLWALGAAWCGVYIHSGSLTVPIAIHAMWNSRVFLSSLLHL